jgi:hypothetical protein
LKISKTPHTAAPEIRLAFMPPADDTRKVPVVKFLFLINYYFFSKMEAATITINPQSEGVFG